MARLKGKKEEITGKLDPKYWVQKSDPLVLMRTVPFTLGELKILDTYISRINAADDTRRTVIFTKEEYEELMGLTCVDYRTLKKHTGGMLGKVVTLEMPNKEYVQFVLFEQARYHKDEYGKPIIELTCTTLAQDLFFCINKYHYFKYALENVISLTHKASYLLYVYIRSNRYRGEWDIDLNELRDTVLDCKKQQTYKEFKEFKKAVLAPAVKEVNQKTDCHFVYEAIKRGRRVAKIKFIYQSQDLIEDQISLFDEQPNVPQLPDQSQNEDEDELRLAKYGSEMLSILAEAVKDEFSKEEMEAIDLVLSRIDIPRDQYQRGVYAIYYGRQRYLREKYAALNAEAAKKERKGQKPIANRFKYFLGMLENDTFQPAAYKD